MAKRRKARKATKVKAVERFCVIQPTIGRSKERLFFAAEDNAIGHAVEIIEGNGPFLGYRPATLLVVKVVKVIQSRGTVRLPTAVLEPEDATDIQPGKAWEDGI